ncbi:MAG: hypothetical protein OXD46_10905 [Chloroflexi bacterium]|nr:hypothetical protein [Chloroflexota bacterium]
MERVAFTSIQTPVTLLAGIALLIALSACSSGDDSRESVEVIPAPTSADVSPTAISVDASPTPVSVEADAIGTMHYSRVDHSATLLRDGRVLVAGGMDNAFTPLRTAELFNPETNRWEEAAEMRESRTEHSATLLRDGRVMVTGGLNEKLEIVGTTEIFDPDTGKWSQHEGMRTVRRGHFTLPLNDGRVLVVGGVGQTLGGLGILANISAVGALLSTEIYDPQTDLWSRASDMREGHSGGLAVVLKDGRVLVAGGYNQAESLASSEVFDPKVDEWIRTASMARKTFANTATVLSDGSVLFTGGFGMSRSKGGITPGSEVFDPQTNEWRKAPDTVHGRMRHTITLLPDGRVVTIGGSTASGPADTAEYMDPETWAWSEISPMSVERSGHTATLLQDGRILVAGGALENVVEVYDVDTDEWTSSDPQ